MRKHYDSDILRDIEERKELPHQTDEEIEEDIKDGVNATVNVVRGIIITAIVFGVVGGIWLFKNFDKYKHYLGL